MQVARREFLQGLVAGSTALGIGWNLGRPVLAAETRAIDSARRQSAHRRRRIIYNNDGDDIFAGGATTREKFLEQRHTPLLGTQVDSIYYNTTQSFNYYIHKTDVAEMFLTGEEPVPENNLPKFLAEQTDGLRMSCEFAHAHGMESMWTMRMNDIHDAKAPVFVPQWKKDNPRCIMAALADVENLEDRRRLWSLVDFENREVEPRILAIIEEVLRNYPVDGIDLDFLRAPFYFRTAYEGKPATEEQTNILTRLATRIRQLILTESERQGKPFLLTCRVPVTEAFCKYIGIDIRHWIQANLIDTLSIGGGYVVFDQPIEGLVALGHEHQIPVYPCLSRSGMMRWKPRGDRNLHPIPTWYGAASRLWASHADGIQVFNLFPNGNVTTDVAVDVLKTIGDPETIKKSDRIFAVSDAGSFMPSHYWAKDVEEFSGALPVKLNAKSATSVPLVVADVTAAAGAKATTELRLEFTGVADSSHPNVRYNSQPLGQPVAAETLGEVRRLRFPVASEQTRPGRNEITVEALSDAAQLVGAELWVTVSS